MAEQVIIIDLYATNQQVLRLNDNPSAVVQNDRHVPRCTRADKRLGAQDDYDSGVRPETAELDRADEVGRQDRGPISEDPARMPVQRPNIRHDAGWDDDISVKAGIESGLQHPYSTDAPGCEPERRETAG